MLLRNLKHLKLCIRTHLVTKQLFSVVNEENFLTGVHIKEEVFIPRTSQFKLLQFSMNLSLALAIKKAQKNDLFEIVGLNQISLCISYSHLYIACSRLRSLNNILIQAPRSPVTLSKYIIFVLFQTLEYYFSVTGVFYL